MKRLSTLLVIAICLAIIPNARSQSEDDRAVQLTRSAIQAERQAILDANLELDAKESAAFWPLYQEYRTALEPAINTRVDLLNQYFASYQTLTDKEAIALLDKHIAWEQEVLKVRSTYAKKMSKALSGKTVARFFQIENKMDIIVEYEMAGEIPLIK
jgi:hypothetical protein